MHDTDRVPSETASDRMNYSDPVHPDSFTKLVVVVSLVSIALTILSVYTVYQNLQLKRQLREPRSFEECIKTPGSRIEESNPSVCVTHDGYRLSQSSSQMPTK